MLALFPRTRVLSGGKALCGLELSESRLAGRKYGTRVASSNPGNLPTNWPA
jgi:hypothetical protein